MVWHDWVALISLGVANLYFYSLVWYFKKCLYDLRCELDAKNVQIKNKNIELTYLLKRLEEKNKMLAEIKQNQERYK